MGKKAKKKETKKTKTKQKHKTLIDEGEMGDEKTVKLNIHYGGTMSKEDDLYKYNGELGLKTVYWKKTQFEWLNFVELSKSVGVEKTIQLIWYREANADMRIMGYVFDSLNSDMSDLVKFGEAFHEVEVYLHQTIQEEKTSGDDMVADDGGYDPDDERNAGDGCDSDGIDDEDDRPPKEDDDPEDSEDDDSEDSGHETATEVARDDGAETSLVVINQEIVDKGKAIELDDGDDVIIDAENGYDDDRFLNLFQEGSVTDPYLEEEVRELSKLQKEQEKEADVETDPEFGLEDELYPDTPLESDEEWEQWKNPRNEKQKSEFHGDMDKEPYLWLFQTFNSALEFKDQLLKYSLNTVYDVKMAKSEANRIAAVCKTKKCPWRVFCSVERRLNKWMVKVCHYEHNHVKNSKVSMLKQGVIAGLFREEIRRNIHFPANHIQDIIKERYGIVVNISKCFKGRKIAVDSVLEAHAIQFGKLWDYEVELIRSNPGISTEILTFENNGREQFQGFYICFKELRDSWRKWCRPVIGLDGCFLKWDLEGDLLAAVGRDADNKMYPIAWAVVTGETQDTWGWFVEKLKSDLELGMGKGFTVISDKQKGLINGVATQLPEAEHRMCARHIYATWKKKFSKSEYKNLFWGVAYSYHEGEYKEKMKVLEKYDNAAYQALLKQELEKWCRAFFDPKSRCAEVHNNLTEAFNRTIKMARTKPVITMLEDIRRQAMRRISRRWIKADKVDSFVTPITMAILERARIAKKYCKTIRSSATLYEVTEHDTVGYTVDIGAHQCACKKWDLTGIPCRHAICVFDDMGKDSEKYVAEYYEASALKNTYAQNIKPVNGEKMWLPTGKPPIAIPDIRKPRGRPKTRNRRKEPFEDLKNPGKSTRHGRIFHCSQCGQEGHIKSGCKNEPLVVEGPKRGRGRPRKLQSQSLLPPKVHPKKRKTQPAGGSQPSITGGTLARSSSQSMQPSTTEYPASSSAPQPSVSSNKPRTRKRKVPLKVKPIDNVTRAVGMLSSPFTGRPFQVFGDSKGTS